MTATKKVLYIEDAFENRLLVKRILEAEGYLFLEAENARSALKVLERETPDMILMDINMPDVDGYTLTAHLRRIPKLTGVPIIAVTANVMRGDRERSITAGCDGYIQKPIDVDKFSILIAQYMNR